MSKLKSREEKIRFLKNLHEGKANVDDLRESADYSLLTLSELKHLLHLVRSHDEKKIHSFEELYQVFPEEKPFLDQIIQALTTRTKQEAETLKEAEKKADRDRWNPKQDL
jgi:hypothetical protein